MVEAIVAIDLAAEYVRKWTKTETRKLIKSEPLLIPTKWGLQVGKYAIKSEDNLWRVYNDFNENHFSFSSKRSATVFCLLSQTGRYNQAQNLYNQDTKVSKLVQDKTNYSHSKNRALKRKDMFAVDVLTARLTDTDILLNLAKIDLEKTLNQAKYLKGIWEKPL